ncbi:hypothetical protein SAMN02745126_05580 [Enhydrobacter aerosaccus]|uniref:Uncharacterized protein n=1 Tax=Enhydrobacter aerosaccus TaxID=225324 RepID=A0A1T4T456_9HYPH|nr:hypothetical protein [Enhydrobacter aerosaccus]SKA34928.1 hypothetical protein SAMN02745126_05580 [Enhydrobacter aerosaccus]
MADTLNVALEQLRQKIAQDGGMPVVIALPDLEREFHGLSLHQLVLLTDAPALGSFAELRSAEGGRIEQFVIDGKNTERCEALARDLLLSESALSAGDVREVRLPADGTSSHILVRDHNDIVYRVTDQEAVVDQLLTSALQHRRQARQAQQPAPVDASPRPIVIENGVAFTGTAGEILHGLAAVRARNGIAVQEIERLIRATGQRDLGAALAAAGPQALAQSLTRVTVASQQIESLIEAMYQRMRLLLQLIEEARMGGEAEAPARSAPTMTAAADPTAGISTNPGAEMPIFQRRV